MPLAIAAMSILARLSTSSAIRPPAVSDERVIRDGDVVEADLVRRRRTDAELVLRLRVGDPGCMAAHGERGDSLDPRIAARLREDDQEPRLARVRDEHLAAAEAPAIAVAHCFGADGRNVRARVRLGEGERRELFPACERL